MPKIIFVLVFLLFGYYCKSQQSYFNVTSSEITAKHKMFFQEQLNFNTHFISNTTIDYGLNNKMELGLNILNTDFDLVNKKFIKNENLLLGNYSPLYALNFQTKLNKDKKKYFTIGTQLGFNNLRRNKEAAFYCYLNYKWNSKNGKCNAVIGTYYGDQAYLNNRNDIGLESGIEYVLNPRWHLMADALLSRDAISNGVAGVVYYVKPYFPISLGYMHPILSADKQALVIEITYVP